MKKHLEKYLKMGCKLSIYTINGEEIKPSQYLNIELFDNCFSCTFLDNEINIYPYSSILKITVDTLIPL